MKKTYAILLVALLAAPVTAAPTVDGTKDAAYGAHRAVQTIETGFGDNESELNAGYGVVDGGRLYLMLTGNIQANFNKLEIFIDSVAGGENVLSGTPGNDGSGALGALTFDTGFDADYHMIVRRGFDPDGKFDVDFAQLGTPNFESYQSLFGTAVEGSGSTGTGLNASPIEFGYDNSNVAGIGGNTGAAAVEADALAVMTGLELSIALSDLGGPTGPIKVSVFQSNGGQDWHSNQFLGGLPVGSDNLGPVTIDMSAIAGNQYFTIPEPGSLMLAGLGLMGILAGSLRKRWG